MKQWTGEDLAEVVGTLWAQTMVPRLVPLQPDVVIPIPLHWTRRWRRRLQSKRNPCVLPRQGARQTLLAAQFVHGPPHRRAEAADQQQRTA